MDEIKVAIGYAGVVIVVMVPVIYLLTGLLM